MGEAEEKRHPGECRPGEGAERYGMEWVPNEVSHEEAAPENLLQEGHNNDEPKDAEPKVHSVGRAAPEEPEIETANAPLHIEQLLRGDPYQKRKYACGNSKEKVRDAAAPPAPGIELVLPPPPDEERSANDRLKWENPILGTRQPPRSQPVSKMRDDLSETEQAHENSKRPKISFCKRGGANAEHE
jgi:hypothetical protein